MFSKKSVVVGWMCSYLVILSLPIIAIFVNYHFNVQVIKKEIVRANELVLDNLQERVDEYLQDEMTLYNYVYTNEVMGQMLKNKKVDTQFYHNTYDFLREIKNNEVYTRSLSFCVFFREKDYVLDEAGGNFGGQYYDSMKYTRFVDFTFDDWKESVSRYYKNAFFVTDRLNYKTSEECLVYADTIEHNKECTANVFVFLPVSRIKSLIQENDYNFLIASEEQNLLCISGESGKIPLESIEEVSERELIIDGEQYICIKKSSAVSGLSYKLLVNKNEFWEEAQHTRNNLVIVITITMMLGLVCVSLLLKRNQRPLSALLRKIGGEKNRGNEFAQIEAVYESLMEKNEFMQKRILSQNELIERNELMALLKGRVKQDLKEEKELIVLRENEQLSLVGIEVPMPDHNMIKHDEMMYFIVDNVFSELMEDDDFYKLEDGQHLFYLFKLPGGKENAWRQKCMEKAEFLCNFIYDHWKINLTVAVSGMYGQKPEEIKFLYRDVMEAFEYQELVGGGRVIDTGEIQSEGFDMDFSAMVEMALQKETATEMQDAVNQILTKLKGCPMHVCQMRVLEMFQQVAKDLYEYNSEEIIRELFKYLEKFLAAKDKKETKETLNEFLICAYDFMGEQEGEVQSGIVDSIKEYIERNYTNVDLNIKGMAAYLGWNPKYISRVFRQQEGTGILDYINDVRIDKSILLLSRNSGSIEEISEKVGYASSKTFRRAFAKKMGVAPSKYKEK